MWTFQILTLAFTLLVDDMEYKVPIGLNFLSNCCCFQNFGWRYHRPCHRSSLAVLEPNGSLHCLPCLSNPVPRSALYPEFGALVRCGLQAREFQPSCWKPWGILRRKASYQVSFPGFPLTVSVLGHLWLVGIPVAGGGRFRPVVIQSTKIERNSDFCYCCAQLVKAKHKIHFNLFQLTKVEYKAVC